LGVVFLWLYLWLEPRLETWLKAKGLAWQLGLALIEPLLLTFIFLTEEGVTMGAVLLGLGVGLVLERLWLGFEADGPWRQRALRYVLGVAVMIGLWLGLRLAFAGLEPAFLFRFIRYGLMGLWGALGAPWVLVKLGLAGVRPNPVSQFSDSVI
jgi:hypothetical protein